MGDEPSMRKTHAMERGVTVLDDEDQRGSLQREKYKIINATMTGAAYHPTPAQILAAQMAEEFYGTRVTFVHSDPTTFKSVVQELTGNGSPRQSNNDGLSATRNQARQTKNKVQRLELPDTSPSSNEHYQSVFCLASSSPVSHLAVSREFENSSSGDGARISADRHFTDPGPEEDGSFTFPCLIKERAFMSDPPLLQLFPETPDNN